MFLSSLLAACAADDDAVPQFEWREVPVFNNAICDVNVSGVGTISMEDDYLPQVVSCENGGADFEALKAQAIAARSVAYYAMASHGSICDSQACQVYTCNNPVSEEAIAAVDATRGQYLTYNGFLTYGFYVAGDLSTAGPGCEGDVSVGTEHWVTYNEGEQGTAVEQTPLGFVHDVGDYGYGQNRGCMSQWGARCLEASAGFDHLDILRFYYGADIGIVQAQGTCASTVPEIIVDNDPNNNDPTVTSVSYSSSWAASSYTEGYWGTGYRYASTQPISDGFSYWFYLDEAGAHAVDAWWTAGSNRSPAAPFLAFDGSGTYLGKAYKDQRIDGSHWNELGTFNFTAGWNRIMLSRWSAPGYVVMVDAIRIR